MSFIKALALIVIAILSVVFVVMFIRRSDKPEIIHTRPETSAVQSAEAETTAPARGFQADSKGRITYVQEDGSLLKEGWLEHGASLNYFDAQGYMVTGTFSDGAMDCQFAEDGSLKSIRYNASYVPKNEDRDYVGLAKDKQLWAYVNTSMQYGDLYPVMYVNKAVSSLSHLLGGKNDPQYTSPYAVSVMGNYIYYLALPGEPDSFSSQISGKLYRMSPDGGVRQLAAEGVEGYKIVATENGSPALYCYRNGKLERISGYSEAPSQPLYDENGRYYVNLDIPGKAYLVTETKFPVLRRTEGFPVGDFIYRLAEDGQILEVAGSREAARQGWTYRVQTDELFGQQVSRIVRRGPDGREEVISSEFYGSCGNLHYDQEQDRIFGEYQNTAGQYSIVRISKDGDVDYLIDSSSGTARLLIWGIADGKVTVQRLAGSNTDYLELRTAAAVPLAPAVEPIPLSELETPAESLSDPRADYYDDAVGRGPGETQIIYQSPDSGKVGAEYGPGFERPGEPVIGGAP